MQEGVADSDTNRDPTVGVMVAAGITARGHVESTNLRIVWTVSTELELMPTLGPKVSTVPSFIESYLFVIATGADVGGIGDSG